ncbi:MAG TPA: TIM-barrel domain-containing protein [Opitutaceae bacterium]|nr:TIM-barrel domain-containing protein [Opitutaceae bacterium]
MPQSNFFRFLRAAAALAILVFSSRVSAVPEATYQPIAVVKAGLIAEDVAAFVPAGLDPEHLPKSFALLQPPKITTVLPSDWKDTPTFTCDGPHFRATLTVANDVDLYGGGEVTGPLRRNGTTIRLWNTDNYTYEKDTGHRLYQSHPWMLGVRADGSAFGVIFDSTWKAELSAENTITFTSQGPAFPVYVIERPSPQDVLRELADLTGHMPLPPRWALGYQQCRYSYNPDSKVREIADNFRSRNIPCDVIWMDIDYMDAYRIFTFRKDEFPEPKKLNGYLHDRGFHSVWMIDPGVKLDPDYFVYRSGTKNDVWVKNAEGQTFVGKVWPGDCVFPDFTRPETRRWWSGLYKDFIAQGVDGVWNDMNEPAVFDTPDWTMPEDNWHRGGGDIVPGPHRRYHNVFGMLMVSATREGLLAVHPDKRPFVLTRANFLGGQRYAATWTGDNASREEHLEMSIPMSLTLGLSGQPFNGPDIGGFGDNATAELWARWIGLGAFYPFSRGHAVKGSNNKEPWAFGPAVEQTARIALQRRYRLLPYFYTQFRDASLTGLPIMRPAFWSDLKNPALRAEERVFSIGPDLLVVPRWADHPALPSGDWREVSLVEGDTTDVNQPSLRIRAGSIVPLGKIVQNTNEESLDPLTLLVAPDEHGTAVGQLYEDAGDGFAYQKGEYILTTYRAQLSHGKLAVSIERSEGKQARPNRKVIVRQVAKDGTTSDLSVEGL